MSQTRDDVRAAIFHSGSKRFKRVEMDLFGSRVEVRQPTIGQILEAQEEEDRRKSLVRLMVGYCFVPGTDEKVFEDADFDSIMGLPFDDNFIRLNTVIEEMIDVNVLDAEGNSGKAS